VKEELLIGLGCAAISVISLLMMWVVFRDMPKGR
jgi:hypothetical protein